MKSLRPVKRYFAGATAARNARAIDTVTVTLTMISVFFTSVQKNGVCTALEKWEIVGCPENQVGVKLLICSVGLKADEIIQNTGKTMTAKRTIATTFQPARPPRRRRRAGRAVAATALNRHPRSAPSCGRRRC